MATDSSAAERLTTALERIDDPKGEGRLACLTVYRDSARAAAEASDLRARSGISLGPLDGIVVTIKDLFDVAGETTRAGSIVLAQLGQVAADDAPVIRRLRRAGAVIVAKTNMSEFAFSGLGNNPHFGTPRNPADRSRIPGRSTSGGAVAVGDGMCAVTIGTDTGGSTRIPAALCGLVGFKPSKQRVPTIGAYPLSSTFDSIGVMARSVHACVRTDEIIAGKGHHAFAPDALLGVRVGVVQGAPLAELDETVQKRFDFAIDSVKRAGADVSDEVIGLLDEAATVNAKGGLVAPEAFKLYGAILKAHGSEIDPNIRARIERGRTIDSKLYHEMVGERSRLVRAMNNRLSDLNVIAMPTCPIVAPTFAEVAAPESWARSNAMVLRNTAIANFFDMTAISLPIPGTGLPVGFMLLARNGQDHRLYRIAAAVERLWS